MAIAKISQADSFYNSANIRVPGASQYLCDSEADVENLPLAKVAIGSRAMVIETGHIYILGPSKKWVQYKGIAMMD